ncbi:MAG: hypothetical protein JWN04_4614 [Myxococcaceae bacterium]|nr:hypothetical protein [Myxococcaceae bacterium]
MTASGMRNRSLISSLFALSLAACAAAPGDDAVSADSVDEGDNAAADGSIKKDGGHSATASRDGGTPSSSSTINSHSSSSSSSSSSITIKSDAGSVTALNPLEGLSGLLGGGASDAGKAAAASKSDSGVHQCENLVCFDIFDCAIFHPDALDCGFTACTGFVCSK